MSDDDRIIRFPGQSPALDRAKNAPPTPAALAHLSEDQRKALSIVMSGMPFILVGISATDSGADFFTALHGADADLRNAQSHLPGVIERAYSRKGL